MSYHFGLLLGMLTGMLAGIVLVAILFKKKVLDMHFDERQELARGKAFQYGFLTLVVCLYAYGATELAVGHWCDVLAGVTICIALSMGVFAVTCICRDAYLSFRNPVGSESGLRGYEPAGRHADRGRRADLQGGKSHCRCADAVHPDCVHSPEPPVQKRKRRMKNLRMKSARAALDMSQQDLADAVGVSRQTINAIEKGDYNPTIKLCRAICRVLGKTLDELFWEE